MVIQLNLILSEECISNHFGSIDLNLKQMTVEEFAVELRFNINILKQIQLLNW